MHWACGSMLGARLEVYPTPELLMSIQSTLSFDEALGALYDLLPADIHLDELTGLGDDPVESFDDSTICGVTFRTITLDFWEDLDELCFGPHRVRIEGPDHSDDRDNGFRDELFWHVLDQCLVCVHFQHEIGEDHGDEPVSGKVIISWPSQVDEASGDSLRSLLERLMMARVHDCARSAIKHALQRFDGVIPAEALPRLVQEALT